MSFPLSFLPNEYVDFWVEAQDDIAEIGYYFDQRAPEVKNRFYRAIDKTIEQLVRSPNLGERHPSRSPKLNNMRQWQVDGFPNHAIFYRPVGDRLEILRVLHGARNYAACFNGD